MCCLAICVFFFFEQSTSYEMRISDWSSDVCSSDLAEPMPSAADTRWQVRAAPSQALEANAPGHAALEIELLRRRAGPAGMRWRVEWNRDECIFREPALSGAVVSLPFGRPAADKRPLRRTA